MIKGIIFDFNRTLYLPETEEILENAIKLLQKLKGAGLVLALLTIEDMGKTNKINEISSFFSIIKKVSDKSENDFVYILENLDLGKEEVVVIGDRIKKEIKLSNRLGIKTVWYRSGKFKDELPKNPEETPTYVISDLEEVWDLIKSLEK